MTLWQHINEKWNTLPDDSEPNEFKPRLMLHLSHSLAGVMIALTGWHFIGEWWHWGLGVTVFMFLREMGQRMEIKERMWSCLFDVVQVQLVWFVLLIHIHEWIWACVSLMAYAVLYVFFLLRDEDWIEE